ncbi:MAG: DUF58 domain-containing protein [Bryobacterales bacterium]|nr:DUF58 domain-containing protein [Bryobacterales bacterium]
MFVTGLLFVAAAAVITANNLLFLILAAMLSTLMISGLISSLSLAGLELEFLLPEHVTARQPVRARALIRNLKRWMPSFSIRLEGRHAEAVSSPAYIPLLPGGARMELLVEVRFERRGLHRAGSFLFSTGFPFGFLERSAAVALGTQVLVYPPVEPQPGFEEFLASVRGELETQSRGRGQDFYRIRPYEPFESARHVDWKATAHTGELQVREFARDEERLLEIYLDLDVPSGREDWFEKAVECCAFLVWRLSERAARIRFRTQLYEILLPEMGDACEVLRYLALVQPFRGRLPESRRQEDCSQLLFSLQPPARLHDLGWRDARIVGLELLGETVSRV